MLAKYPRWSVTGSALSVDGGAVVSPATVGGPGRTGRCRGCAAVVAARGGEQGKCHEDRDQEGAETASHGGILHKVDRISRVFLTGVRSTRKNQDPLGFGLVLRAGLLARVRRRGHDVGDDLELGMTSAPSHRGPARMRREFPRARVLALASRLPSAPTRRRARPMASRDTGGDGDARAARHRPRLRYATDSEEQRDQPLHDPPQRRRWSSSTPPRGARSPWDRSPAIRHPGTRPRPMRGRPCLAR